MNPFKILFYVATGFAVVIYTAAIVVSVKTWNNI